MVAAVGEGVGPVVWRLQKSEVNLTLLIREDEIDLSLENGKSSDVDYKKKWIQGHYTLPYWKRTSMKEA